MSPRKIDADATLPAKPLLAGTFSDAGRIANRFSPMQRALALERDFGSAPAGETRPWEARTAPPALEPRSGAAKLSKSRAREAHQQAMLGARLAGKGQHAQAIARFRRSIEIDPTSAIVFHDLGYTCLQTGRLEEAVSAFTTAVQLKPDLASAQEHLAYTLDQLGRTPQALAAYQAATRLEPERQMAQFRLGQLYLGRGRGAEAAAAFRAAACGADPLIGQVSKAYAHHAAGDGIAAEVMLRAVTAEAPNHAVAHLVLGEVLTQSGQTAEAARWIERGISLNSNMVGA